MPFSEGGEALGRLRWRRPGASRLKSLPKSCQRFIECFVRRVNKAGPDSFGDQLFMFRTKCDSHIFYGTVAASRWRRVNRQLYLILCHRDKM